MDEKTRITEPEILRVRLLDDKVYKIRALTLAEKKEYLKLIDKLFSLQNKEVTEIAKDYMDLQVEIAYFILSRLNEVDKEKLTKILEGSVFKIMVDFAFQDPFITR